MRREPSVTSARAGKRASVRDKRSGGYRTGTSLASLAGEAKPARRNTAIGGGSGKPSIAIAPASTAPVAMHVNGRLVGLALKVGQSFVFFSAGHRTDDCDGKVFSSLAAIREAAGESPASAI